MFHLRAHFLKNIAATNEHVAAYIRLYLHLKAQRSVLESIQNQIIKKLENINRKNKELLPSQQNKNKENFKKDEKQEADEMIFKNCLSSIDIILKTDIKTAIFEASNFIMKTKDFPLNICSPETVKLVNIFSTSCVALIKFPSTLLANFSETNQKNNSIQNSNKNNNNSKNKKEKTLLDSPIRAYIENTSSSDEYDYSCEDIDETSAYSTYSAISTSDINVKDENTNGTSINEIQNYEPKHDDTNGNVGKNNKSNINTESNQNNDNNNTYADDSKNIIKKKTQKIKRNRRRDSKESQSTVICRLCNEPIPINLFAEHIKSCAIAFKSELKVQDVNQMLLQEYDIIGNEFISAPWPGERQKAINITFPMLHLSILLMRAHDIEENTNDSLEELESIEHSILHIPFVIEYIDKAKNDHKKEGNALYRNVSNYNNEKMKPSKNNYKKISLKPVGSSLLNHFSRRKARNSPLKKSTDDGLNSDASSTESDYNSGNNNNSNENNDCNDNISSSSSKRNSFDLQIESPVLKYVNESLKLLREKINLTVVLCAASDILRNTRLSGSDKITTIKSVVITNFEFIKLISAGAYARVFLAQMKTTGDVCAVKVTPKASCTHKNEVLQLITEKNIMLKFNNPYIVTFCMYFYLTNIIFALPFL